MGDLCFFGMYIGVLLKVRFVGCRIASGFYEVLVMGVDDCRW